MVFKIVYTQKWMCPRSLVYLVLQTLSADKRNVCKAKNLPKAKE